MDIRRETNPTTVNMSASIVFPLSEFTFIYLHNFAGSADRFRVAFKNNRTNLPAEVIEVNNSHMTNVKFVNDDILRIFTCPEIDYFGDSCE